MCTLVKVKTAKIILLREAPRLIVHLNVCAPNREAIDLAAYPRIVDVVVGITVGKRERPVQRGGGDVIGVERSRLRCSRKLAAGDIRAVNITREEDLSLRWLDIQIKRSS